jgi:hypothetical protein
MGCPIFTRKLRGRNNVGDISRSYISDLFPREFCEWAFLAAFYIFGVLARPVVITVRFVIATSCYHVGYVFWLCSKAKMCWIATRRIVAGMEYFKSGWYCAFAQFVCYAMGIYFPAICPSKHPVSIRVISTYPRPTSTLTSRLINARPKSFWGISASVVRTFRAAILARFNQTNKCLTTFGANVSVCSFHILPVVLL